MFVDEELDKPEDWPCWLDHKPRSESDEDNYGWYDLNLVEGMPVNVQVVTGKFAMEKEVMVAEVLETL